MKKIKALLLLALGILLPIFTQAQTNTFPSSGSVGIGITSPTYKLHVVGTTYLNGNTYLGTNQLQFLSASGGNNRIYSVGGSIYGTWTFKSRFDNMVFSSGENDSNKRSIMFQTGDTERMRIDNSTGNVGIGTTSPSYELDVNGSIGVNGSLEISPTKNYQTYGTFTSSSAIAFSDGFLETVQYLGNESLTIGSNVIRTGGGSREVIKDGDAKELALTNSGSFVFRNVLDATAGDLVGGGTYIDRFVVTRTGEMGIGTSTPVTKLDIVGNNFADHSVPASSIPLRLKNTFTTASDKHSAVDFVLSRWELGGDNRPETRLDFRLAGNAGQTYDQSVPNIDVMSLRSDGNVGIGTTTPGNKLEVNGTIRSKEVIVEATNWPDYVFEESYNLPSLSEIEAFIKANKHLPEVPSAKEAEENGIQLGEMNTLLLKKIEELTLHTIEQQKLIQKLADQIQKLETEQTDEK